MGKKYPFYQVDSFTRKKFSGNPAGVVLAADGLIEAQMQAIARELNNSETAFVLAPEADDFMTSEYGFLHPRRRCLAAVMRPSRLIMSGLSSTLYHPPY